MDNKKIEAISKLIEDEWQAVAGYQNALSEFEESDKIAEVIKSIIDEEIVHVGELQACLKELGVNVKEKIKDGIKESKKVLKEEFGIDKDDDEDEDEDDEDKKEKDED